MTYASEYYSLLTRQWRGFAAAGLMLITGLSAAAEELQDANQSKAKVDTVATTKRADVDEEITNPKLRAETGSKSLFSVQSTMNYNGGSVSDPFGEVRPRLSPGQVELDPTKITGNISAKYRVTDHDNINFGTGVGWLKPSHEGQRGQMENPFIAYSRPYKIGRFQNFTQAQGTYYTSVNSRRNFNLNYGVALSHNVLTQIGNTGWNVGTAFTYTHDAYSRLMANKPLESINAFPYVEYWFNPKVHFRTVYRGLSFFNTGGRRDLFLRDTPTQSMGIGFVVTRDIYLYPNLQWVWEEMQWERTNVALAANINLF